MILTYNYTVITCLYNMCVTSMFKTRHNGATTWPQNKPRDKRTTPMIQEVGDRQQHRTRTRARTRTMEQNIRNCRNCGVLDC